VREYIRRQEEEDRRLAWISTHRNSPNAGSLPKLVPGSPPPEDIMENSALIERMARTNMHEMGAEAQPL